VTSWKLIHLGISIFAIASIAHASEDVTLSDILSKEITAMQVDSDYNTPEFQEFIKKFVEYRKASLVPKKGKNRKKKAQAPVPEPDKERLLVLCEKFDSCRYIEKLKSDPILYGDAGAPSKKRAQRMSVRLAKRHFRKGEFARLENVRMSDLAKALDQFTTLNALKPVIAGVMEPNDCRVPDLLLSLALRTEDFFPDAQARTLAIALYGRITRCAERDSPIVEKSLYRMALLYYWSGDYALAEKPLQDLASHKESDFRSRAYYWLARCAKQAGKKGSFDEYRDRLYQANPISYYLLLLNQGELEQWTNIHKSEKDSDVRFRSRAAPELNSGIHLVEGLLTAGEMQLAREVLRHLERRMLASESQVRLYMAALAHRTDETIMQFKLLDSVFREDAANISTRTLKMFFPLKQFSVVWEHRSSVDPYLVAALIRQESGFNEKAKSRVGALGLMQLMPRTARLVARVSARKLFEPETNVKVGVKYFKNLLKRFDGDAELALAGYNAGPDRVDEWVKRYPMDDRMLFLELIPFAETRKYVSLIDRNYYWYLSLYGVKDGSAFDEMHRSLASSRQRDKEIK
jgi:soluble lytic murein transglycosylase